MPRYFLHVVGKTTETDAVGTHLPSAAHAKREGVKLLGALLNDGFYESQGCAILLEIVDEEGLIVTHIDLTTWGPPTRQLA